MRYKTILVHCDARKSVSYRLGVAADLAPRFGACLVGLHVRRPFEMPVFADSSFPTGDFFKAHEEGADAAAWFARHGVKVTVQRDVAPDADVGGVVLSRAADQGVDLIVMGIYGDSRMCEMVLTAPAGRCSPA